MTRPEAITLALLRCGHGYTFGKIGMFARNCWGMDWVKRQTGCKGGDQIHGEGLVMAMEAALGLETCESDDMVFKELFCTQCRESDMYLTYESDTAKECKKCGGMNCFLP